MGEGTAEARTVLSSTEKKRWLLWLLPGTGKRMSVQYRPCPGPRAQLPVLELLLCPLAELQRGEPWNKSAVLHRVQLPQDVLHPDGSLDPSWKWMRHVLDRLTTRTAYPKGSRRVRRTRLLSHT